MRDHILMAGVLILAFLGACTVTPTSEVNHAPVAVETAVAVSGLRDLAFARDSDHEVRIVLYTNRHLVGPPTIVFQVPGLPGDIRSPMVEDGQGNFELLVPARSARPGRWQYAIDVPLASGTHRLPEEGFRSFDVARPQRPSTR